MGLIIMSPDTAKADTLVDATAKSKRLKAAPYRLAIIIRQQLQLIVLLITIQQVLLLNLRLVMKRSPQRLLAVKLKTLMNRQLRAKKLKELPRVLF
ncbi:hypothetical protein SDC49_20700 [Lactobacillus sp. R2/2]|nr:hypothetical protein [Lactobacillus sp. R2/2]